jgi:hypothetical protein
MSQALDFLNSVLDECAAKKGITREQLEEQLPKDTHVPNMPYSSAETERVALREAGLVRYRETLEYKSTLKQ